MDGNHFNEHGIKAVGIAPGYFKNHTCDEYIHIDDILKCGELAFAILAQSVKSAIVRPHPVGFTISSKPE